MISIQYELARGRAIRHCDWPPFHYAKLTTGPDGKRKLYRCYPDGHIEILNIRVGELRSEDGWLVEGVSPDGPIPVHERRQANPNVTHPCAHHRPPIRPG